jgi:hypothetical protein
VRSLIPVLAFVAFCLVVSLAAPFGRWPWSLLPADFRLPFLAFATNLVLVAVTWIYVLITREQLREIQAEREPLAVLHPRIPNACVEDIKYGKGHGEYREGPPIFLDVWNVSGPTIMVLRVALSVTDCEDREVLEPQVLVESGKVASINVAYKLMNILSAKNAEDVINFADKTRAITTFVVEYFSLKGTRSVQSKYEFLFRVSDTYINTKIVDHKA